MSNWVSAIVYIADMVSSSINNEDKQYNNAYKLFDAFKSRISDLDKDGYLLKSTGDGFLFIKFETVKKFDAIDCAIMLQEKMREANIFLKQSMTYGQVRICDNINDAIGNCINECRRINDVADAGHILVSETFVNVQIGTRAPHYNYFKPFNPVLDKHGAKLSIYNYYDKTRNVGNNYASTKLYLSLPFLRSFSKSGHWSDLLASSEIVDLTHDIDMRLPCTFTSQNLDPMLAQVIRGQSIGLNFHTTCLDNFYMNYGTHIDFPMHLEDLKEAHKKSIGRYELEKFVAETVVIDVRDKVESFIKEIGGVCKNNSICLLPTDEFFDKFFVAMNKLALTKSEFCDRVKEDIAGKAVVLYTELSKYWVLSSKNAWDYLYFFNPYITFDLAEYFVEKKVKLVGIDALQIENPIVNFDESCTATLTEKAKVEINKRLTDVKTNYAHRILLSNKIMLLENMTNVGLIVNKKSLLVAPPLKIVCNNCGDNSVVRAFAIVLKTPN